MMGGVHSGGVRGILLFIGSGTAIGGSSPLGENQHN